MEVSGLWRYPVKSLRGITTTTMNVTNWGPDGDRRWMLVDPKGRFVSQRELPQMCRFAASNNKENLFVEDLRDGNCLRVECPSEGEEIAVEVWSDRVFALDAGSEAGAWFSARLGRPLRLCYLPDYVHRQVDLAYARPDDRVSFADGFPFLICNQASVDALSSRYGGELSVARFRPNIVISGAAAFAEQAWRRLSIGGVEFEVVKPCSRCAIPTIDPGSGRRDSQVFQLLREHCSEGGEIIFGQNAIHRCQGEIALGDGVELVA